MAKTIAVFGATGQQGGAVVRAMLKDKQYVVRAITRNPDSEKGIQLKQQGCEVVTGDMNDMDSLLKVTRGAHGAFINTDYFSAGSKEVEIRQGKFAVDACKQNHVEHIVFSGLESSLDEMGIDVPDLDSKWEVENYIKEQKIPFTIVRYPFYYENFIYILPPEKQDDGTFLINLPLDDKPMEMGSVENAGKIVHALFNRKEEYLGKTIGISGGRYTMAEVAQLFSKHCAPAVIRNGKISLDEFRSLPIPFASHLGNMFEYIQRGKSSRDPVLTRKLDPGTPDLEQWIVENRDRLRKQFGSDA